MGSLENSNQNSKTNEDKNTWEKVGVNEGNYEKYREDIFKALLEIRKIEKEGYYIREGGTQKYLEHFQNSDNYKIAKDLHNEHHKELMAQLKEPRIEHKNGRSFRVTRVLMPKELQEYKHGEKSKDTKWKNEETMKIEGSWHFFINKITNGAYFDYRNLNHVVNCHRERHTTDKDDFLPTDKIDPFTLLNPGGMYFCTGPNEFPKNLDLNKTIMVFTLENKNFYNFIVSILQDKMKEGFDTNNKKILSGQEYEPRRVKGGQPGRSLKNENLPAEPIGAFSSFCRTNKEFLPLFLINSVPVFTIGFSGGAQIDYKYFQNSFLEENNLGIKEGDWPNRNYLSWIDLARYIYDPVKGELYEPLKENLIIPPEMPKVEKFEDLKWDFKKIED